MKSFLLDAITRVIVTIIRASTLPLSSPPPEKTDVDVDYPENPSTAPGRPQKCQAHPECTFKGVHTVLCLKVLHEEMVDAYRKIALLRLRIATRPNNGPCWRVVRPDDKELEEMRELLEFVQVRERKIVQFSEQLCQCPSPEDEMYADGGRR